MLEVAQFMRQHGFHFFGLELVQQGIKKHDALLATQAGEVRIAMGGAARAIHHIQAIGLKAATLRQGIDAFTQAGIFQWFEGIENGGDNARVQPQHQQIENQPQTPAVPGP